MQNYTRTLLLAGASILALGGLAGAKGGLPAPIVVAQADPAAVSVAEQAVLEARANLEIAKQAEKGVKKARKALDEALVQLEAAQAAAEQPEPPAEEVVEELAEEAPAVAEEFVEPPPAEAELPPESADANVADEVAPPDAASVEGPEPKAVIEETTEVPEPTPPPAENVEVPEPVPPTPDVAGESAPPPPEADVVEQPEPPTEQVTEEAAPNPPAEGAVEIPEPKPPVAETPDPAPQKATKAEQPDGPRKGPPPESAENVEEAPAEPLPETVEAIEEGQKVEAAGGRTIEKNKGRVVIRHEDDERFRSKDSKVDRRKRNDGLTVITVERPNGDTIVTVRDADGDIVKRSRQTRNGREVVLIDNQRSRRNNALPRFDLGTILPPVVVNIPRQDYVVESRRASPQTLFQTLVAPPVETVERPYSLDEVRYNQRLRDKVRRIDVDTVTFDFGQAYVPETQIDELDGIARAIQAAIRRDEREVFLVEGHTDAVGSEIANLALSDRRAESVAEILTYYYDIPPENLITQGYGEGYLKIPTQDAERQNRRVTLRRITPLLNAGG